MQKTVAFMSGLFVVWDFWLPNDLTRGPQKVAEISGSKGPRLFQGNRSVGEISFHLARFILVLYLGEEVEHP